MKVVFLAFFALFSLLLVQSRANSGKGKPGNSELFEALLSKAINKAVKQGLEEFFKKRQIHDPLEKELIQSIDLFAPSPRKNIEWIGIYLIKPGKETGLIQSFDFSGESKTIVLRYTCTASRIKNATAVLTYLSVTNGKTNITDVGVEFSMERKKWQRIKGP